MPFSTLARRLAGIAFANLALMSVASSAKQGGYVAPKHTRPPPIYSNITPTQQQALADEGTQVERMRDARWLLAEHRRLDRALAALQPQRKGVVDAYVLTVALDSDPVFGREAREAAKVLSRRYGAAGRTITLAGTDGSAESPFPRGSPDFLALAIARIAELMDVKEDVLVLYSTSHGAPMGVVYNDGDEGFGIVSPKFLARQLREAGIERRILIISACYSGVFVPALANDNTVLLTAASAIRTSFGCRADNDWTFFGDALINNALRKNQSIAKAADEARGLVAIWEDKAAITSSQPQVAIGSATAAWLTALESRIPAEATAPVGKPAIAMLDEK